MSVTDTMTNEEFRYHVRTNGMIAHYQQGLGCLRISKFYGVTPNDVYKRLLKAGIQMRPRYSKLLPKLEFNGETYTYAKGKGYYRKTRGDRSFMHHDVWEFYNGPVPEGYEIRHKDKNCANNDISNLFCCTKADGSRIHQPMREIENPKHCHYCGDELRRHWMPNQNRYEVPKALMKRNYCSPDCGRADRRGKPRTHHAGDPVERVYPIKYCLNCGDQLRRRVQQGGKCDGMLEAYSTFMQRRCCSYKCAGEYRKAQKQQRVEVEA